ncbi:MAG TPA: WD40 repeat domain-containing protein [Streptosporangiaceae bacterium]
MTDSPPVVPSTSSPGSFRPHGRCTLLHTDISGFGRHRLRAAQEKLRAAHYRILALCLESSGLEPSECYWEDRGDGIIVVIPGEHDPIRAVHPFLDELQYRLREHNLDAGKDERIRLRMALHVGDAYHDEHGLTGPDVNLVFRLIDARRFKDEFRESVASLAFIASDDVYERVIKRAPRLVDPDAFEQILVVQKETRTTAWMQFRGRADPRVPGRRSVDHCPYPGLAPFGLDQASWFFGRERAITELLERLERQLHTSGPLIVVGASGVGKSSLLSAGLLHHLRLGKLGVEGSQEWTRVLFTPTADPIGELYGRLGDAGVSTPVSGGEQPGGRAAEFSITAHRPVIVVDQFEEIFTLCSDEELRHRFIRELCALATPARGDIAPALVVVGLRAEFFDRCTAYQELQEALRAPLPLAPMTPDELRDAIQKPADAAGFDIEPGLVRILLSDLDIPDASGAGARVVYDTGALPLLAHALRATWQVGGGHGLTLEGYQAIGTVRRAIAQTADQVYEGLDDAGRRTARRLLLNMIKISEDSQTRRRADRDRLVGEAPDPDAAEAVLEELASARLVTLAETTAEIAHDVLLRAWPMLGEWIDADRAGLLIQQRLAEDADRWVNEGRHPSFLYRGPQLAQARGWVEDGGHDTTPVAREFLDAATRAELREQRAAHRRTRRLYMVVVALACLTAVTAASTLVAVGKQRQATHQRNEALSNQIAGDADALLPSRSELGLLLSVQAYRIDQTVAARDSLLSTQAHYLAVRLPTQAPANDLAFSPDGDTLVAATQAGVAEWNVASRPGPRGVVDGGAVSGGVGGAVYGVAYGPRGHLLALARADGGVVLRDGGRAARVLPAGPANHGPANGVAFSPDGRLLAGAGYDGVVRVWDTRTGDPAAVFDQNIGPVEAVAFAPDGRVLAGVGADPRVALWDVRSHRLVTRMEGHVGPVRSVAFSPDGRVLASGGDDGSVRLWDARTHAPLGTLIGHIGPVRSVAFSPDGRVLASGGDDGSVRLWDVGSRGLLTTLTGSARAVTGVRFSPDGGVLAGATADGSVALWRLGALGRGGRDPVHAVTIGPNGDPLMATAGGDRAIQIWDARTGRRLAVLDRRGQDASRRTVNSLAFGSGGRLLAAANDKGVTLWTLSPGAVPAVRSRTELRGKDAPRVGAVAFSPDGHAVAGASDKTLTVWDTRTLRTTALLTPHPGKINTIAFSPDGRTIATGNDDQTATLTPVPGVSGRGGAAGTSSDCSGHLGSVEALAFSPRGDLLASAGTDHLVKLWRLRPGTCDLIHTFADHTQPVTAVAFSADGGRLASASEDEFINVWDLGPRGDAITAKKVASLRDPSGVTSVLFGRDSDMLISIDPHGRPVMWDTDPGRVADRICRPHPPLPPDWGQYVPAGAERPCT